MTSAAGLSLEHLTLAQAVQEIEVHVARGGWDGPPRVFALVRATAALAGSPELESQMPELVAQAEANEFSLLSIEQEDLPVADSLDALLAALAWPATVDGAAVVVERVIVPPAAEAEAPADPAAALEFFANHPQREEVRIATAVLRAGLTWTVVRTRRNDSATEVGQGPDLVPGLTQALAATFE